MASDCRTHSIKVSDETWAAWAALAKSEGLSVTKTLVKAMAEYAETCQGPRSAFFGDTPAPPPQQLASQSALDAIRAKAQADFVKRQGGKK